MKTISRKAESAIEIKRSRFIGRSFKAATPDEALAAVKRIRETWRDATHHCWAYRVGTTGEQARYNNGGVPQGDRRPSHPGCAEAQRPNEYPRRRDALLRQDEARHGRARPGL